MNKQKISKVLNPVYFVTFLSSWISSLGAIASYDFELYVNKTRFQIVIKGSDARNVESDVAGVTSVSYGKKLLIFCFFFSVICCW